MSLCAASPGLLASTLLAALLTLVAVHAEAGEPFGMRRVAGGMLVPFYGGARAKPVRVQPFYLDRAPVTNEQFLRFVQRKPKFARSRVARLLADREYLSHWSSDNSYGDPALAQQPVTFVSWFAARSYCEATGKRLPTEYEWELAARASATRRDAHVDPEHVRTILDWYARPHPAPSDVMLGKPNIYGIYDLHGLVWEWVEDFNASIVSADDRSRDDDQTQRVCGGAATGSSDPADYAAFMRYAFRSSLKASYAVHNLGFRCAVSQE